jgi:plastocyanin
MVVRRIVVTLGLACLVVAACRGSLSASPPAKPMPSAPAEIGQTTIVRLADFRIEPDAVVSGPDIEIDVVNDGPTPHTLTVRGGPSGSILLTTPELRPGTEVRLTGHLDPGTYTMFCALPGHESLGMRGTLVVENSAAP